MSPTGDCGWLAERTGEFEFICTGKSSWYSSAHRCSQVSDDFSEVTQRQVSDGRGKEGESPTGLCYLSTSGVDVSKGRLVSDHL